MPINGELLGLQRRDAPLGEIRIGTSVEATDKAGKPYRKPQRLETFRFTTSEANAAAVAARYGGKVAPWTQRKGKWEVITDRKALDVWVPPRGLAVDANMELWDGPKRLRHCDGVTELLSGRPCMCPRAADPADEAAIRRFYDERKRLSKLRPPQACKTLTRINVTLPDLPGLTGVWRLNTGSENAAVETAGAGDIMTIARGDGIYLPAVLSIQWRYRAEDGSPYPVPFLQIGLSMEEVAKGLLPSGAGGLLAQLQGHAPAGDAQAVAGAQARAIAAAPEAPVAAPEAPAAAPAAEVTGMSAQYFADLAPMAQSRDDVEAILSDARESGLDGRMVRADEEGTMEELRSLLRRRWRELPAATEAAS
jgi:hypothetical protein